MSTDQPSQEQADKSSPRPGLVVGVIGIVLLLVLLCGVLLRNAADRKPSTQTQSNLTLVQPETRLAGNGQSEPENGQQPNATTLTEQTTQGASLSQSPENGKSETPDDSPSEAEPPGTDAPVAPAHTDSGTRLATLEPIEIDGIQQGLGGLWQPVIFSGRQYEQALCMARSSGESTSQISFSLDGNFAQLSGIAGLQDVRNGGQASESGQSVAIFRIYGDANLLWDSEPLTAAGAIDVFQLEVTGLDTLTLVVENGLPTDGAQPAWADLRLVPAAAGDDSEPNGGMDEP